MSVQDRAEVDAAAASWCSDRFTDDRPLGTVVGSVGPAGARRLGVDVEHRIGIDNGALRLRPLASPGWGREAIGYGPFDRRPGLAFAAHVLNGHNASQTFYFPETWRERLRRILSDARRRRFRREHHYENLAVGFLPSAGATDVLRRAHTFVMHAATEDNGELWTASGGRAARAVRGVLNVPIVYVVALRPTGAAYYTSSLPGATGTGPYPSLRPMGIDPVVVPGPLVAAVQQRILGEVGYRVDTRVHGVEVATIPAWSAWYGTAHAADTLEGSGLVVEGEPEAGGRWVAEPADGRLLRTLDGARPEHRDIVAGASLVTTEPIGLVHALVTVRAGDSAEVTWRGLTVTIDEHQARVRRAQEGGDVELVSDPTCRLRAGRPAAVQVLDDGEVVAVHVDGRLVGDAWLRVPDIVAAYVVRIALTGTATIRRLEVHPRLVPLPAELDCGAPWTPPDSEPGFVERFDVVADDLHGTSTPSGGRRWSRDEGGGRIELHGGHARVRADRTAPNPGRTIFTVPWDDPHHADLSLDMTVPGTRRGEGHNGRCGVVFWEDEDNYLVVNVFVDDVFDGASISTFYHLGGHEDMYDAVWTLVRGVEWGKRCVLRATFDGETFLASTNGEPALVRALTDVYPETRPLRIRRVGIIVNREWGDDTGTVLHRFSAGRHAGR